MDLLLVDLEAAREAVRGEVRGDLGPPAVAPGEVPPEALQHAAVVTQAEAVAAAAVVRPASFSHLSTAPHAQALRVQAVHRAQLQQVCSLWSDHLNSLCQALTAVAALAALRRGKGSPWDSDARAVPALVATALGQHPAAPPGPAGSASGLPTGALAAHTAALLKRCVPLHIQGSGSLRLPPPACTAVLLEGFAVNAPLHVQAPLSFCSSILLSI